MSHMGGIHIYLKVADIALLHDGGKTDQVGMNIFVFPGLIPGLPRNY